MDVILKQPLRMMISLATGTITSCMRNKMPILKVTTSDFMYEKKIFGGDLRTCGINVCLEKQIML